MEETFASVTSAITLAKQLVALADTTKNSDLKLIVADLTVELANVKMQLADVLNENTNLKQTIRRLEGGAPQLEYREGLYFNDQGQGRMALDSL